MKTNLLKTTLLSLGLIAATGAQADSFVTKAQVLGHEAIYENVLVDVEKCRFEKVAPRKSQRRGQGTSGDEIISGVLGGALGSAVGKGSGRDAATAAGVVLGKGLFSGDRKLSEGEIIGGILGGVAGNQIGGGSGKTAATGLGALLGSELGDDLTNGGQADNSGHAANQDIRKRRVCRIYEEEKSVVTGYQVFYKYGGRQHSTVMHELPGKYISVNVAVSLDTKHRSRRRH